VSGSGKRAGWSVPGEVVECASRVSAAEWPSAVGMMIGAVDGWRKWALFAMRAGGAWTTGPFALLGDASHAMLPFAAQGAGMAIEDAAVIAKCLEDSPGNPSAAFARYASQRAPRATRAQRTARKNGQTYHLAGPVGFARDQVIRMLGGSRLLSRQDWIYDWRLN
jgi:salicylate hydroxylase